MLEASFAMDSAAERRTAPREATSDPARLVTPDGLVLDVVVVDRSLRGMRIRSPDVGSLMGRLHLLSRSLGAVYEAKVVWRTAPYAGLLVTSTVEMRSATGPEAAEARRLWREHIAR